MRIHFSHIIKAKGSQVKFSCDQVVYFLFIYLLLFISYTALFIVYVNKVIFSAFLLQEWYTVYEQYRRTNCVVSDLIMGNEYVFRVFSMNMVGLSPEPCDSKESAYIQKTGETSCVCSYSIYPTI